MPQFETSLIKKLIEKGLKGFMHYSEYHAKIESFKGAKYLFLFFKMH